MGKRGPKPKRIVDEKWSSELAYAVGLLATDGCLLPAGHQVDLTSKDKYQLENFLRCLGIKTKIGRKHSGLGLPYWRVQFKNVLFYNFLISIGLTPAKSKTLGPLKIPKRYFLIFCGEYLMETDRRTLTGINAGNLVLCSIPVLLPVAGLFWIG
ncbi:hypothetical protein A3A38_04420 [Candidatus Kaiserbacteria bacterium RIFCSPLOWO2_01_FULL_53_17]|uniref:Homing endonuclease LAGLIDADG domain-containing protein n=1 Tax=Candidatus Kaiserbacteria bacterium RIFCSPLOWO2_01_FULL_53_17 TaxID=1798511 RepID=A0A1F6EH38_9BACT|nr:MAG: hypothetical protein A3A38_04420 [Candidatus Kaiserbacteria bacterium RIFCSPLOWO2_01_FULL_53_17]